MHAAPCCSSESFILGFQLPDLVFRVMLLEQVEELLKALQACPPRRQRQAQHVVALPNDRSTNRLRHRALLSRCEVAGSAERFVVQIECYVVLREFYSLRPIVSELKVS